MERFVEGLDEELEDLSSFQGIDNWYITKMRRLEETVEEVWKEWFEAMIELEDTEYDWLDWMKVSFQAITEPFS